MTWRRVAVAALLASLLIVNTHVRGDGNGYYAWLASSVVDHDLDFRNQYQHADPLFRNYHLDAAGQTQPELLTVTGHVADQWAVGPAMLWAPWFLAAHVVVLVTGTDPQDGYAPIYRRAVATGSVAYAFLALLLSGAAAKRFGLSDCAIRAALVVIWGASSLLMYVYMLPFHVHTSAAFTTALFLWYWICRDQPMRRAEWAIWGASYGLMGMTYHVDLVFGLVALHAVRASWSARRWRLLADAAAFAAMATLVALPQWISKAIVYGSPLATGYGDQFFWWSPRLWETLFSSNHGAILWTPVIAIGIAGLAMLRRDARVLWMSAAMAVFYVTIASYQNWHGLSSFGNRFFISLTLPLVIGVAAVIDRATRVGTRATRVTIAAAALLIAWNAGLAFQWASKMIPNRGPVHLRLVGVQQTQVPRLILSYGYRYFTDRDNLIDEIERRDRAEQAKQINSR